ncbi:hypothetical protein SLS62_006256 [Diatrype stigma]|uniref:Zn(2)-C6 fungal-type domain-containing protein n=1 Tax=Diatrype stigma TaxID=117547 RepID=A0AAN9UR94_9PEZI
MPSPFRSSVSVKTESAYGDETTDEVENAENAENEAGQEDEEAAEAATDFEAEDIAFVASDLVPPAASSEARQSKTGTPRDANDAPDPTQSATTGGTPRCEICRTQKQRCTFENPSGKCDKCFRQGYECHIVDTVNSRTYLSRRVNPPAKSKATSKPKASSKKRLVRRGPRGARRVLKCDWCRKNNRTCLPEGRVWPAKCALCQQNGLPCSPPARDKRVVAAAASAKKTPAAQAAQNYTSGMLAPEFSEGSDDSEESDGSDTSIPAVLPPARKRQRQDDSASGGGGGGSNPELEAAGLREAISRMEDEYQEVLRSIQSQHKQELDAMRARYELATEELANATRNHERRLDDLIYIMKNNERRADEIIQSLKNK